MTMHFEMEFNGNYEKQSLADNVYYTLNDHMPQFVGLTWWPVDEPEHDDELVRRGDVMKALTKEYNDRYKEGGLKLAWIEKAVNSVTEVKHE